MIPFYSLVRLSFGVFVATAFWKEIKSFIQASIERIKPT